MRKINFKWVFMGLVFLTLNQLAFAHGSTETKSKCSGSTPFKNSWRWGAKAYTNCGGYTDNDSRYTCIANLTCFAYAKSGSGPKVWQCAEVSSSIGGHVWGQSNSWRCTRGTPTSDLYASTNDLDSSGHEGHNITHGVISFDGLAKSITIPNISGYFNNSYHYLETRFVITIWLPDNANDSVMTSGKTKWEGHIYLLDGSVSANNFSPSTHYTITNDSGKTVTLNNFGKTIDLSSLSAEDFSNLVVDFSCHSIDNSDQFGNILSNSSESKLKVQNITLAINKGKEDNTFNFLYKDSYSKSIKIDIFDINGKRIFSDIFKTEEIGVIRKEFYLICSSSVIFVRVETEDKKVYYKKFSNQ